MSKKTIAVIAAHPDDEVFGCGGTLLKCKKKGFDVHLLFMTNGISARDHIDANDMDIRHEGYEKAVKFLGPKTSDYLDFPDNQLDTVPFLTVVKEIEKFLLKTQPDTILTHYRHDLNLDHRLTANAVLTASRPGSECFVPTILSFEVPSSTHWNLGEEPYVPNLYIDISDVINEKMKYLDCYASEMRGYPHARSMEKILALSQMRGADCFKQHAEAFILLRGVYNEL
ncbi:MAG: PIG-L family deacetylase [Candidatus Paracaedibacteraceae bacterium]|nr:PIG-L family deacetylase [Candidatus Paracaedibacteraceae bacterium]